MAKPWDDLMKRLFMQSPQQMVQWLIPGAQFIGERSLELKTRTIEADILYNIVVHGKKMVLHVEFQRRGDRDMGKRLWEYNALTVIASGLPVRSIVIYLKKTRSVLEPPYMLKIPDEEPSHVFFYRNVKLWELSSNLFRQPGSEGLLPLIPLTRDGTRREVLDEMIVGLIAAQKAELLSIGYMLSALVFKKDDEREWLNRRFAMFKDILKESWAYQDILREGLEEGREQGIEQGIKRGIKQGIEQGRQKERDANLKMWRQALLSLTETHFPGLTFLAKKQANAVEDPMVLQRVMVSLFSAKTVEEARQYLLTLESNNDTNKD